MAVRDLRQSAASSDATWKSWATEAQGSSESELKSASDSAAGVADGDTAGVEVAVGFGPKQFELITPVSNPGTVTASAIGLAGSAVSGRLSSIEVSRVDSTLAARAGIGSFAATGAAAGAAAAAVITKGSAQKTYSARPLTKQRLK